MFPLALLFFLSLFFLSLPFMSLLFLILLTRAQSLTSNIHSMQTRSKSLLFRHLRCLMFILMIYLKWNLVPSMMLVCPLSGPMLFLRNCKHFLCNQTWSVVSLPPGGIPAGCKWLFQIKRNANGDIARYKARLVAKGFQQKNRF